MTNEQIEKLSKEVATLQGQLQAATSEVENLTEQLGNMTKERDNLKAEKTERLQAEWDEVAKEFKNTWPERDPKSEKLSTRAMRMLMQAYSEGVEKKEEEFKNAIKNGRTAPPTGVDASQQQEENKGPIDPLDNMAGW